MANLNLNQLFLTVAVVALVLIAALFNYRLEVSVAGGLRFEPPQVSAPLRAETQPIAP